MKLTKILYRAYRLIYSVRGVANRRFTRAGLAVLSGTVVSGTLGLEMEHTVAYQVFSILLALLTLSFAFCLFFRGRFSVHRILPRFGTVGQPLAYSMVVRNETPRLQVGLVAIDELANAQPGFDDFVAIHAAESRRGQSFRLRASPGVKQFTNTKVDEVPIPPLPAGEEAEVKFNMVPVRRGYLRFDGVAVARPDPIGLVKSLVRVRRPESILVLPKRYLLPSIALPGTEKYQQGGVAMASSVGQSEEFVSLREYRPGDPLRHIHWRSWARAGKPIVKEFADEFFVRHALILDSFLGDGDSEIFEDAVSIAASFACTIRTQESLLDLLFVGPEAISLTAGRGLAHTEQMLEILAAVSVCRDKTFETLEHLVFEHISSVSGCVCVFVAWDEQRQSFVTQLQKLGVPVQVLVIRPRSGLGIDSAQMDLSRGSFHVLEAGAIQEGLAKL